MTAFLAAVVPAVLAVLVAYRGAISRTSRLRATIRTDNELRDALPAEHPSRAKLEGHLGELVDVLVWREREQFQLDRPPVASGPVLAMAFGGDGLLLALLLLLGAYRIAVGVAELWPPEPLSPAILLEAAVYDAILAVGLAGMIVKLRRRRRWLAAARSRPVAAS
jgi:hypothetical protein